ncbi:MAG: dTDP-4-dehydro-6-deoxyglucose aminotransferase, partial [Actinobacteria bacterium]|nr:dTDP-4-dehydro-6-deoxyglucose aminotransferase [Actinomycetota bacterium]
LSSLESMADVIDANRRNYLQYREELKEVPGVRVAVYDESDRCNYQYVVLEVDESGPLPDRDFLVRILHAENVIARRYFHPGCHRMEPYRTRFPGAGKLLPVTERLAGRVMSLPTGTSIGGEEIQAICSILRTVVENGPEVRARLEASRAPR